MELLLFFSLYIRSREDIVNKDKINAVGEGRFMNSGDEVLEFFDVDENGRRVPAIAPEGNPGGAAYFDGESYNYDMPFSPLEAPIGSVYPSRRPQLLRTGWIEEE